MSMNLSPPQPLGPLSVGNVVSASLRLYRDRFKLYYRLAFIGYLWVLIPIYGWAKFSAMTGLLSRLAFSELIERPETVNEARSHVMPRMWSFLGAGILVALILFGASMGAAIAFGILAVVFGVILGQSTSSVIVLVLLGAIAAIAFIVGYLWLTCRLLIVELPLAMEDNVDATSAIGRSWKLTEGFVSRIVLIFTVGFLISLPISIAVQIVSLIVQGVLAALFTKGSGIFFLLYYVLILGLSFASGSLLIPFWQAVKTVLYYDLLNRREGLGLQVRDSSPQ